MQSILAPRDEARIAAALIEARRAVRLADKPPHDVEAIRLAQAGMVRVMADALRECALIAGDAKREDLLAIGFTVGELDRYGTAARAKAVRAEVRTVRRIAA